MIIILLNITLQLSSIISTFKSDIQEVLDLFSQYGHLWEKVSSMIIYCNTYTQRYSHDYHTSQDNLQLNSIISTFKSDIQEVLDLFSQYGHLWEKVSSMIINFNTSQDYPSTELYHQHLQE